MTLLAEYNHRTCEPVMLSIEVGLPRHRLGSSNTAQHIMVFLSQSCFFHFAGKISSLQELLEKEYIGFKFLRTWISENVFCLPQYVFDTY